jgi:hypothetical protein
MRRRAGRVSLFRRRVAERAWWNRRADELEARGFHETATQCRHFAAGNYMQVRYAPSWGFAGGTYRVLVDHPEDIR